MMKTILFIIFFIFCAYPVWADEEAGSDQDFLSQLDSIKNPFEEGFPKPIVVVSKPVVVQPVIQKPVEVPKPMPKPKPLPPPVVLPDLNVQGVIVGGDVYESIINDQDVAVNETIDGAEVTDVEKTGVELKYKDKKFFLNID